MPDFVSRIEVVEYQAAIAEVALHAVIDQMQVQAVVGTVSIGGMPDQVEITAAIQQVGFNVTLAAVGAPTVPMVSDEAMYQFFLADNIPYKQFVYSGGLLVAVNLYDDAGLIDLRYKKDMVRAGDFLTSIVLTRYPDEAQWTKTLSYNFDDALETVATAAA